MQTFSDHMFRMADTDIPEAYPMSDIVPVITLLECQPEQWIRSIAMNVGLMSTKSPKSPKVISKMWTKNFDLGFPWFMSIS